jgi:hypothetical protein
LAFAGFVIRIGIPNLEMGKKAIIVTIIVFFVVGSASGLIYYKIRQKKPAVPEGELISERAEKYLEKKRLKDVTWRRLNFEEVENQVLGEVSYQVGECFSITVPFTVQLARQKGKCHQFFSITDPRGEINAYQSEAQIESLDDDPGVNFRRKGEYEEATEFFNGREFIIFSKKEPQQEMTAFHFSNGQLLVVSLTTSGNIDVAGGFMEMLESIIIK